MSMMRKSQVAAAATAAALVALPASAVASYAAHTGPGSATAAAVNRQISLKGSKAYPKATGSAQYQSQQRQREVQVEVQHVRSLAGKRVVFSVAGTTLGRAKVSPSGHADITRNTEKGQKVPTVTHGSRVTVRTTGGTLIVSGRF